MPAESILANLAHLLQGGEFIGVDGVDGDATSGEGTLERGIDEHHGRARSAKELAIDWEDELAVGTAIARDGAIVNERVAGGKIS